MSALTVDLDAARDEARGDVRVDPIAKYVKRGHDLDAKVFDPLRWAVEGLIPEGVGLFAAPPKIRKSWFALLVLLGIARGEEVLGGLKVGPARPVLYLALEDGDRRMQSRCRLLLEDEPIPSNFHYVTSVPAHEAPSLIGTWLEQYGNLCPVVVVDTLALVRGQRHTGENEYERDYRDIRRFTDAIANFPGITLLIVHHTRKMTAEDFLETSSGTNGLTGAVDFNMFLTRARGETSGLLKITGKDVAEAEYAVTLADIGHWKLDGSSLTEAASRAETVHAALGLGDRSSEVVEYVAEHPEGVTPKDVAEALTISNDDAGKYLRRLASAGRIDKPKRGYYIPVRTVRLSETDTPIGHSDTSDTYSNEQS